MGCHFGGAGEETGPSARWRLVGVAPSGVAIVLTLGLTRGATRSRWRLHLVGAAALMARSAASPARAHARTTACRPRRAPAGNWSASPRWWRCWRRSAARLMPRLGRDARVVAAWEELSKQWRGLERP